MSKVGQVVRYCAQNTYVGRYASNAAKNIYGTYSGIAKNTVQGAKIGKKAANINGDNAVKSAYKMIRGVLRKNKLTKEDIPALMGGVGVVGGGAIPGSGTVGYTVGLLIKKGIDLLSKCK